MLYKDEATQELERFLEKNKSSEAAEKGYQEAPATASTWFG